MDKIAIYREVIYKQAAADIIPGDYSRVKQIELNSDEYRTIADRNMRFYEKASENASKNAKKAKKIVNNIKGANKLQKAILGTAAAGAVIGTAAIGNEAKALLHNPDKKKDTRADKKRDKDTSTRVFRDAINPEIKRDIAIAPTRAAINVAMIVPSTQLALKGSNIGKKLAGKVLEGNHNAALAGSLLGAGIGTNIAAIPVRLHDTLLTTHQEIKEMDRLKKRYLDEGITKNEKKEILKANAKNIMIPFSNKMEVKPDSIEEQIQERRRNKAKKQQKTAHEYLDEMYKEAGEKWTKQDRKGYAKNVAIGVAQDFMNAGNPLNVGSSIVGSVLDSALLEKSSLKMNKKLRNQQLSEHKVNNFNKAVEMKNGTALPHAINDKIK